MARAGACRLAITHQNIPNMVGQISTTIAESGVNIVDLLNKSRAEVAYTLLDLEAKIPAITIENLQKVTGVLTVRCL